MLIAGVAALQCLEQDRVEVFPVGQLFLVERLEQALFDLPPHEVNGRKDQIVAGMASDQFGVQRLVTLIGLVSGLETGGRFEIFQGVWSNIVRPVVDIDRLCSIAGRGQQHQCSKGYFQHAQFLGSMQTACPRAGMKTANL
ncbi:hypothetical protein ALP64_200130 [Pseudomonas syringae pv. actinidiae]|nr:hypothetical protein ALP64_200130 [Pseudomonas syringae pv. actinidiae]